MRAIRLSLEHLRALTVVHNHVVCCPNVAIAAERLLGHEHGELFEYLFDKALCPAWPRARKGT